MQPLDCAVLCRLLWVYGVPAERMLVTNWRIGQTLYACDPTLLVCIRP